MPSVSTLGENRTKCHACGLSCYGHDIALIDDDEVARIERCGETLGVDTPVVDGAVRFAEHRCVFLGDDGLCRIHAEIGFADKPLRCQLWPLKLVRAADGLRFGVDPGCLHLWHTWRDAPQQQPAPRMVPEPRAVHPQEPEEQLLGLLQVPHLTVPGVFTALSGGRDLAAAELPEGMATRFVARLQALRVRQFLAKPELGELPTVLDHLPDAFEALDRDAPPAFADLLTEEQQAFALEVARRKLWIGSAPVTPAAHGLVVLTLLGAVGCAWADPTPEIFGPALSAWSRLIRFEAFWLRLAPDTQMVRWLMTGQYDGPFDPWGAVGG